VTLDNRLRHQPIMLREAMDFLRPAPGNVAIDCTLGGGGHARCILERIGPRGKLIGIDVDRLELERTTTALRREGFGPDRFSSHHSNFSNVANVLAREGGGGADLVLADLGISAMQADDERRGFHHKVPGPLDMRMNVEAGEPAAGLLARTTEADLAALLSAHADEPYAVLISSLLKRQPIGTTQALERTIRLGLAAAHPELDKPALKMSVRRTFQALRIAVNDEFGALDALLASLPSVLGPGGRVVIMTFHSGEDRRVKQAFRAGHRSGVYADFARSVTRSSTEETRRNRRSSSAKLRWAVRTA
jgi:16S rRNA (cytosine1402-N4)-methyltransferase